MNRGKGIASYSFIDLLEFTKWTKDMDLQLLFVMLDEAQLGNRVNGSSTLIMLLFTII